jgi:hypothetical protein
VKKKKVMFSKSQGSTFGVPKVEPWDSLEILEIYFMNRHKKPFALGRMVFICTFESLFFWKNLKSIYVVYEYRSSNLIDWFVFENPLPRILRFSAKSPVWLFPVIIYASLQEICGNSVPPFFNRAFAVPPLNVLVS